MLILEQLLRTNASLNRAEILNAARSDQYLLEKKISRPHLFSVQRYELPKIGQNGAFASNSAKFIKS
jgi:hypothetical protein